MCATTAAPRKKTARSSKAARSAAPKKPANPWIQVADSGIHGRGVYAACDIPSGTRIIEYVGERITKAESERREKARLLRLRRGGDGSVYIFILNKRHDLDGRLTRNPARLINHSCQPNCRSENLRGHIWIVALRDIPAGAELSFDYGFPFSEWRMHPCRCGTKECIGFIVSKEQRWRVRKYLRAERRRPQAGPEGAGLVS